MFTFSDYTKGADWQGGMNDPRGIVVELMMAADPAGIGAFLAGEMDAETWADKLDELPGSNFRGRLDDETARFERMRGAS